MTMLNKALIWAIQVLIKCMPIINYLIVKYGKEQRGHSSEHLLLCSEVERKSNMFGTTCGWAGKHPNENKSLLSYFSTVLNFLSVDRSGLMCLIWGDCLEFPRGLSLKLVLWKSWMSDSLEVEERLRLETHSQSQVCVRAREPEARRWGREHRWRRVGRGAGAAG